MKKFQELKNTTDYKLALYEVRKEEREKILAIIDGHKEVYQKGETKWDKTVVTEVDAGQEKAHLDSCCNESIDGIIEDILNSFVAKVPEAAFVCKRKTNPTNL